MEFPWFIFLNEGFPYHQVVTISDCDERWWGRGGAGGATWGHWGFFLSWGVITGDITWVIITFCFFISNHIWRVWRILKVIEIRSLISRPIFIRNTSHPSQANVRRYAFISFLFDILGRRKLRKHNILGFNVGVSWWFDENVVVFIQNCNLWKRNRRAKRGKVSWSFNSESWFKF